MTRKSVRFATAICILSQFSPCLVAQIWEPVPLLTAEQRALGVEGGEGCQRIQTIAIDAVDGSLVLVGTDVGGMYRSLDGGKSFHPNNMGYGSTGISGYAIDPRNPDRILAVGDHAIVKGVNGIYLSTDRGESWRQVLPKSNRGRDEWRPIAYDPSSYDPDRNYCVTAYWFMEQDDSEPGGALYRSDDGGESWQKVADGSAYGGGHKQRLISIHPETGDVYVANQNGFFVSRNGGKEFSRLQEGSFNGLALHPHAPYTIWLTTADALMKSDDSGASFEKVESSGNPGGFYRIAVSPVDPRNMITSSPNRRTRERYFSKDGGSTWAVVSYDLSRSWVPPEIRYDSKSIQVAWHPVDPEIAIAIGPGDMISKTKNGGELFAWSNEGINNIMIGGAFNFSPYDPDIMYFGSQDYNGGLTTDGGETWKYINLSISNTTAAVRESGDDSDPWGYVYGGYSPDGRTIFGGNREHEGKLHDLWISFDGGQTSMRKVRDLKGLQVSYSDPKNPEVLFCWNQRSSDGGKTWRKMDGCDGVLIASFGAGRELYGAHGKKVVRSTDGGASWDFVSTLPLQGKARVLDVAYDHVNDRVWVATSDHNLFRCDGADGYAPVKTTQRLPRDWFGEGPKVSSVAIDPIDPNLVYAGSCGTGLIAQRDNAVARSIDGGKTWESLTCNPKFAPGPGVTPAQMSSAIRVHPKTRELWSGSCCFGFWKIGPPDLTSGRSSEKSLAARD